MKLIDRDNPESEAVKAGGPLVYERSDAPWYSAGALVFRTEAVAPIRGLLLRFGELLPLACRDTDLVMYNPTQVVDCLDEGASGLMRTPTGVVLRVTRHVFREEAVKGVGIFKLPRLRVSATYFEGEAARAVIEASVRGLKLYRAWDSEDGTGDVGPWFGKRQV